MARKLTFTSDDGRVGTYYAWIPRKETKAVVQIVHGMAEHAARYEHFAKQLTAAGYSVYAQDLRGHGATASSEEDLGFFADDDGWFRVVKDVNQLTKVIMETEKGKPVILIGHSMGSFIARTCMILYPDDYLAFVLSGTAGNPGLLGRVGQFLATRSVKRNGPRFRDAQLDALSFGAYNNAFKPNRTKFDWLSRDETQVDTYVADPLCGFICTAKLFEDLLSGLRFIHDPLHIGRIPKDLPVLLVSGEKDPVGKQGAAVRKVYAAYQAAGLRDVQIQLFPGARHEILNETNRKEVESFIIDWIEAKIPRAKGR